MQTSTAPVVIIGAGPTGCTAALLLAQMGIRSILLERQNNPKQHPAAHVINARTLEIWAQISPELAKQIFDASPALEEVSEIRWCTQLFAEPVATIDLIQDEDDIARMLTLSPYRTIHLGQHKLMPILWGWVSRQPLIDFRKGWQMTGLSHSADEAILQCKTAEGATSVLRARFAIACEGANSQTRDYLDLPRNGEVLGRMMSVFFKAPVASYMPSPIPVLAWIYNASTVGVLIHHFDDHFIFISPYFRPAQQPAEFDAAYWLKTIPDILGRQDLPIEIKAIGNWDMTRDIAHHYQDQCVFLAGDACHTFPPTGGYGLNTGVQDVHNLVWKLSAVLEGRANPALLETYTVERKPIAQANAQQSVDNYFAMDQVTRCLGIQNQHLRFLTSAVDSATFKLLPLAWQRGIVHGLTSSMKKKTRRLMPGSAQSSKLRSLMQSKVGGQMASFRALGIELGATYQQGLVRREASERPVRGDGILDYQPTTWPGSRLPHAVVPGKSAPISIHARLDYRSFLVLTGPSGFDSWVNALNGCEVKNGLIVRVECFESGSSVDDHAVWRQTFEVGDEGMVCVRPDGHVLWRTRQPASLAASELIDTLNELWTDWRGYPNPATQPA